MCINKNRRVFFNKTSKITTFDELEAQAQQAQAIKNKGIIANNICIDTEKPGCILETKNYYVSSKIDFNPQKELGHIFVGMKFDQAGIKYSLFTHKFNDKIMETNKVVLVEGISTNDPIMFGEYVFSSLSNNRVDIEGFGYIPLISSIHSPVYLNVSGGVDVTIYGGYINSDDVTTFIRSSHVVNVCGKTLYYKNGYLIDN